MTFLSPAQKEAVRLASLHATGLLDTPPEERFDRITRLAQRVFGMPIALVSLVDEERQWFKSRCGLSKTETLRSIAFCDYTIREDEVMVVPDASVDPRFCDNPLVTGEPGVRCYIGHVVRVAGGHAVGTLCLADTRPRTFSADDLACLKDLAALVEEEICKTALTITSVQGRQALRQANEEFRATFEQAAVGMAHVAPDGSFLRVNQGLCDLLGYCADELMALSFQQITHAPDLEKDLALGRQLLSGERATFSLEKRYITSKGMAVWVNLTVSLLRDDAQRPRYFIAVIEDIQEKKLAELALQQLNAELEGRVAQRTAALELSNRSLQAEAEQRLRSEVRLKASEEHFRTIIESSNDAFVAADAGGSISEWNHAAERIFGWRRSEAIGKPLTSTLIPPALQARFDMGMADIVRDGDSMHLNRQLEIRARTRSGAEVPVEMMVTAYRIDGAILFGAFLRDITERRQAARKIEEKERLLDAVLDTIDVGVIACDSDGRLTLFNRAAREFHGLGPEAITPDKWALQYDLYAPDGKTRLRAAEIPLMRALNGETVHDQEMAIASDAQQVRLVLASGKAMMDSKGRKLGAVAAIKDVTAIKQTKKRIAENEQRLRTITDNLPVYIAYVDSELVYRFANATYNGLGGMRAADMIGKPVVEVIGAEAFELRERYFLECLSGAEVRFETETVKNGRTRTLQSVYIPHIDDGRVAGIYILSTDITPLKQQERQLQIQARVDSLTGLPNRRAYEERLHEAVARSGRTGEGLALLYLDVDHFKQINDSFGHAAGDEVLKEFGRRLRMAVRSTDTVARLAGDEFTIILESVGDPEEALRVAQTVLHAIAPPFIVEGSRHAVSASIGVAFASSPDPDIQALARKADEALYEVKRAGRGRCRLLAA
jgi:diguanylate cyclase (GGDEF)-like protein/PAS domain S-box-containing protein